MKNELGNSQSENGCVLYHYMTWEAFEKTIAKWSLKGTTAAHTNDAFEFLPAYSIKMGRYTYAKGFAREKSVYFCFSKKMSSTPMWSHYADNFKGVCMAFYFPPEVEIHKINYVENRVNLDDKKYHELKETWKNLFLTKGIAWEYEEEYRHIRKAPGGCYARNGMLFSYDLMKHFVGVILGIKCSYSVGYVKALLKQYISDQDATISKHIKINTENRFVVTKSNEHPTKFLVASEFWNDEITGEKLQKEALLRT